MNIANQKNTLLLIIRTAVPALLSNVLLSLYYVVDTYFIGKLGDKAIAAVTISYPINVILFAVSVGLGIGTSAFISKSLGKKEYTRARKIAGNAILISIVISIIFTLVGYFFSKQIVNFISTQDSQINRYAFLYLHTYLLGSLYLFVPNCGADILKGKGDTLRPMLILAFGVVVNIILDPIFIFGFSFIPPMGIRGAALATNISRALTAIPVFYILSKDPILKPIFNKLSLNNLKNIAILGVPSLIASMLTASTVYFLNNLVKDFSSSALAFTGIIITMADAIILFPVYGIAQGLIPVASYLYSAEKIKRLKESINYALLLSAAISVLGSVIFISFPKSILSMFLNNPKTIRMGTRAFRIMGFSYMFVGPTIISAASFQSLGKGAQLILVASARSFALLIPTAWILGKIFNLDGIWSAFILTEFISFTIIIIWLKLSLHYIKKR